MKKLNFGIVGCGAIASWHANAVRAIEEAELIGTTDINPEASRIFAGKYGIRSFKSFESMLSCRDVDVICICTPSGYHAKQAILSAKAGKHIVIEKPMALDLESAEAVIQACDEENVKVEVISQLRFSPAVKKLKDAVDSGLLGRIVSGDIYMKFFRSKEYYANSSWRGTWSMDGGGALMNQGVHGVDLLRYVMGPIKTITAHVRTLARDIEVEDTADALIEYACGALGIIQATTSVYPGYPRRMEINGDKGSIILEEDSIIRWDVVDESMPEDIDIKRSDINTCSVSTAFGLDGHIYQIRDLINAVQNDDKTLIDHHEGKKPIEIIRAIYESSRTGETFVLR